MDYDVNSRHIYCNPDTESCVYLCVRLCVSFEQQLICPNSQMLNLSADFNNLFADDVTDPWLRPSRRYIHFYSRCE